MAPKTIFLKSAREGAPLPKEGQAGAATIYPGHLIELSSTAGDVVVHSTAGGPAARMVAIEDSMQGQEIGDNYADDNRVQYICPSSGDELYMKLKDGETAVIGSFLESAGDGTLQVSDANLSEIPGSVVAVALEALNLSASVVETAEALRIKVQII